MLYKYLSQLLSIMYTCMYMGNACQALVATRSRLAKLSVIVLGLRQQISGPNIMRCPVSSSFVTNQVIQTETDLRVRSMQNTYKFAFFFHFVVKWKCGWQWLMDCQSTLVRLEIIELNFPRHSFRGLQSLSMLQTWLLFKKLYITNVFYLHFMARVSYIIRWYN